MTTNVSTNRKHSRRRTITLLRILDQVVDTYTNLNKINENLGMVKRTLRNSLEQLIKSGSIEKVKSLQDTRITLYRRVKIDRKNFEREIFVR